MATQELVTIVGKDGTPVSVDPSNNALKVELTATPVIDIGEVTLLSGDASGNQATVNANKALQTTGAFPVNATATLTRPANTTQYAAGQQVSATANGSTGSPLSFTLAGVNAGGGIVTDAHLIKSSTSLTNATFRLHLFDSAAPTLTSLGDRNSYAAPFIADYAAYVGYFDFNTGVAGPDGAWFEGAPSQSLLSFLCAAASKTVYGVLEATGAYTPTSGEVFDARLSSIPN